MPAVGEYTRTLSFVSVAVKGIADAKPKSVPMVVPAHVAAPVVLIDIATVFAASLGSVQSHESRSAGIEADSTGPDESLVRERAHRGSRKKFDRALRKIRDVEPDSGDKSVD